MGEIPTFHDGSFDGLCISGRIVHFLPSWDGERSTLVIADVELMKMNDVMQGNIIFELRFISPEKLEMGDVSEIASFAAPMLNFCKMSSLQRRRKSYPSSK